MFDFSFITARELLTILHLMGVALGLGGALVSDLIFFRAARNSVLSRGELTPVLIGSHAVTAGLGLLILSGAGLFSLDPERYLASTKFLAKMTIVGVLSVNGAILHAIHIPRLKRMAGKPLFVRSPRARLAFVISGTVSLVSWAAALSLGSFGTVPLPYLTILSIYGGVLAISLVVASSIAPKLFARHRADNAHS